MRKGIRMMALCCVLLLTACSGNGGDASAPTGAAEILQSNMKAEDDKNSEKTTVAVAEESDPKPAKGPDPTVDYDLTVLTGNMAYAQVANLLQTADQSVGKTVKLIGLFNAYYIESSDYMYMACVIPDPTGCCLQGIEFNLGEDAVYPDDYPSYGQVITVKGVYDTYERDGATFGILKNAELVI